MLRLNASRTAAYASKIRSSSDSPFSKRCLYSAVFPRSSSSVRLSKSGSSVPMYAACSARRLRRRPSPMRRTRSNLPNEVVDTGLGYRLPSTKSPPQEVTGSLPVVHRILTATSVASSLVDVASLEQIPLFAGLTLDQRESVARACDEVEIAAGTTLVREGDFGYAAFAIRSGNADVFVEGAVVRSLGPGDMFGELAVLSRGRRAATVGLTTPLPVFAVLSGDVWRLERASPGISDALRATIAERLGTR